MTFRSYYSGTDVSHFVDNAASNIDSSGNRGVQSDFSAMQTGPDGVSDALTERNAYGIEYRQVSAPSEQTTSNAAWTDVPDATVSFTPDASSEEWLVFVTADIKSSSTLEDQARFRYVVNGVPAGETGVQQGTIIVFPIDPYNVYFHFSRITGVSSQQNVTFQFQGVSGMTAYAKNVNILCIRLDRAGLQYVETKGDTLINGTDTLATLQFTPPAQGEYIVAYSALVSDLPVETGAETWLDYDFGNGTYPDPWVQPNTWTIETNRRQFEPHGLFMRANLTAAEHTFRAMAQLRTTGDTSTARDVRIAAFRTDAFDPLEYSENPSVAGTTQANVVRSAVNVTDPGQPRDFLILAGIHTISAGPNSREAGGVQVDDVFVQRKGDQRLDSGAARIASHYAFVHRSATNFTVQTTYGTGGAGSNTVYSKQSVIYVLRIPQNYTLDLEVQWSNVPNLLPNQELCIYARAMAPESLMVDVWTGSGWSTLSTGLVSGWNNVSVVSFLQSSPFTVRFRDALEMNDTVRDTWSVDVALLHLWYDEYSAEVELSGSGDVGSWTKLSFGASIAWTEGSVNTSIELYNFALGNYPTSGAGCISYVSNGVAGVDENWSQTIDVDPADFRNATGYWKMRIAGVKATSAQFDLRVDWVWFEPSSYVLQPPVDWTRGVLFALPGVFGFFLFFTWLWRRRRRKDEPDIVDRTNPFSKAFAMTHEQIVGEKILLEVDPTADYQHALFDFVSEAWHNDEAVFVFTGANSFLHSRFAKTEGVKFLLLASKASYSQEIEDKDTLVPANDLSVLLDAFVRVRKSETKKTVNVVFDNLSDTILLCGFEKTYKFVRLVLEASSSRDTTVLFVFIPTAHDPKTSSFIRGLFHVRLVYAKKANGKQGLQLAVKTPDEFASTRRPSKTQK